jgi:hypothetical protein
MTYESVISVTSASNVSSQDEPYDREAIATVRGMMFAAVGGAIFWGTCFAVWHYFL